MAFLLNCFAISMLLASVSANSHAAFPPAIGDLEPKLSDKDFVFNLKGSSLSSAVPAGAIYVMNRASAPALKLNHGNLGGPGLQALVEFAPCGFRTPHSHPRGTENFFILKGRVEAGFVRESGHEVVNRIRKGYSGFFPAGVIHYFFNNSCRRAKLLVVFDTSDPGTVDVADSLKIPGDLTAQTLGVSGLKRNDMLIKMNLQQSKACLARCRGTRPRH